MLRLHVDAEYKLTVVNPRLGSCKNFYSYRIIHTWNVIPIDILNIELSPSGSNNCFKNNLKTWFKTTLTDLESYNQCTWLTVCRFTRCRLV